MININNVNKFAPAVKKSNQGSFNDGKIAQNNNFIPSSNISTFLINKGSTGSLRTFDNEYSYKINLDNLGQPGTKPPPSF